MKPFVGRYPGELIVQALREPFDLLRRMGEVNAPVVHARIAHRDIYMLNDPELVRQLLSYNGTALRKERAMQLLRVVFGNGLLTSEGETHRRQRRLARSSLDHRAVQGYMRTMVERTDQRRRQWWEGAEIDLAREMSRLTLDILGATLFGVELGSEAAEIEAATQQVRLYSRRYKNPLAELLNRLPLPATLAVRGARRRLDRTALRILAAHDAEPDRSPVLTALRSAPPPENGYPPDRQVIDEIVTLLLAGHETTAVALLWTWYLLGRHPEVEARLHDELDEVLGDRLPEPDDLARLTYTRQVIAEALRIRSPAWSLSRSAVEDVELGGYRFGRGATLTVCVYTLHRHPSFGPDPERFDPDRFGPEAVAARHPFAFIPFSGGPRGCIGEHFAWAESILILATLARSVRLRPVSAAEVGCRPLFALRPDRELRVRVQSRASERTLRSQMAPS